MKEERRSCAMGAEVVTTRAVSMLLLLLWSNRRLHGFRGVPQEEEMVVCCCIVGLDAMCRRDCGCVCMSVAECDEAKLDPQESDRTGSEPDTVVVVVVVRSLRIFS